MIPLMIQKSSRVMRTLLAVNALQLDKTKYLCSARNVAELQPSTTGVTPVIVIVELKLNRLVVVLVLLVVLHWRQLEVQA